MHFLFQSRTLPALLIAVVGLFPTAAMATEFTASPASSGLYYGADWQLRLAVSAETFSENQATIAIPARYELMGVDTEPSGGGAVSTLVDINDLGTCTLDGNGLYGCPSTFDVVTGLASLTLSLDIQPHAVDPVQTLVINTSRDFNDAVPWPLEYIIRLRVRDVAACPVAQEVSLELSDTAGIPQTRSESMAGTCDALADVDGIILGSVALTMQRSVPADTASATVSYSLDSGGTAAPTSEPQWACTTPSDCQGAAAKVNLSWNGSTLDVSVLDYVPQVLGSQSVEVVLSADSSTATLMEILTINIDPQPVADLVISSASTTLQPDQTVRIGLAQPPQNASGGSEYEAVEAFRISQTTPALPAEVDSSAWLTPITDGGGQLMATDIAIPAADLEFLRQIDGSMAVLSVDVVADSLDSGAGTLASNTLNLQVDTQSLAREIGVCTIAASSDTALWGEPVDLLLQVPQEGGGTSVADFAVQWQVSPSAAAQIDSPGQGSAVLVAQASSERTLTVRAEFENPDLCQNTNAQLQLQVASSLALKISVDDASLLPGQHSKVRVEMLSASPQALGNVDVAVEFSKPGLAIVGERPGIVGEGVRFLGIQTSQGLSATVAVDAAASSTLVWPLVAGGAVQCHDYRIFATASVAGTVVARSAGATVKVLCDPEFSRATLLGTAFWDDDGDGLQGPGEHGVPHAQLMLSSGVWIKADAQGRYHVPNLEVGVLAARLITRGLPLGDAKSAARARRIRLTPGAFVQEDFPLKRRAFDGEPLRLAWAGLLLDKGQVVYRLRFEGPGLLTLHPLGLAQDHGGTLRSWRRAGALGEARFFDLPLAKLKDGTHAWLLSQQWDDGETALFEVTMQVVAGAEGRSFILSRPREVARLFMPVLAEELPGADLHIEGRLPKDWQISVAEQICQGETQDQAAARAAEISCHAHVPSESSGKGIWLNLPASVSSDGIVLPQSKVPWPVLATGNTHDGVALGGVSLGCESQDLDACVGDVYGSFYYRGQMDQTHIAAGARVDGRNLSHSGLLGRLEGQDAKSAASLGADYLFGQNQGQVFERLDTENHYPTYGDDSEYLKEAQGGRFFLRVQEGESFLRWGSMRASLGGDGLGQYGRALYGLSARWQPTDENNAPQKDDAGDDAKATKEKPAQGLSLTAFVAQPKTLPAQDIIPYHGLSQVQLSRRGVVSGSLRVQVQWLDAATGQVRRQKELLEGEDFRVDHLVGRLYLHGPLSGFGESLVGGGLTQGGTALDFGRLIVTYEYAPEVLEAGAFAAGAEAMWAGESVSARVGGAAQHAAGAQEGVLGHALAQAQLDLHLGEGAKKLGTEGIVAAPRVAPGARTHTRAEAAWSLGQAHCGAYGEAAEGFLQRHSRGESGGCSQEMGDAGALAGETPSGMAAKIRGRNQWAGDLGVWDSVFYGDYAQAGYADALVAHGVRRFQAGTESLWRHGSGLFVRASGDYLQWRNFGDGEELAVRTLVLAGAGFEGEQWDVAGEYRWAYWPRGDFSGAGGGSGSGIGVVGAKVGYRLSLDRRFWLRRAQPLGDGAASANLEDGGESALGAQLRLSERFWGMGEVGMSDTLQPFGRVGATFTNAGGESLYLQTGIGVAGASVGTDPGWGPGAGSTTSAQPHFAFGGSQKDSGGNRYFVEEGLRWQDGRALGTGPAARLSRSFGVQHQVREGLALSATYRRGQTWDGVHWLSPTGLQDALQLGLHYAGKSFWVRTGVQGTLREGGQDAYGAQLLAHARLSERLALALSGTVQGLDGGLSTARSSIGFAARGMGTLGLNIFGRYALELEALGAPENGSGIQNVRSHTVALAFAWPIWKQWQTGAKVAYRLSDFERADGQGLEDSALVASWRNEIRLGETWDVGGELRACSGFAGDETPALGALTEVGMRTLEFLRLGIGYNFSSISASGVDCREPGAKGVYVRLEALY